MTDRHERHPCASCHAVLSDNDVADLCEQCRQVAGTAAEQTPVLPGDFWEQAALRAALQERHFGRVLRAYRVIQSPQVKQADLANWLGITQGQLSRIERSPSGVRDLGKLQNWSSTLGIPPELLWFTGTSGIPVGDTDESAMRHAAQSDNKEDSEVRRRDVLKVAGLAVAAGSGLLANAPWQRLMDSTDHGRPVDTATVQLMQDRTADFFETEETVPTRHLLDGLTQHKATLVSLLKNTQSDAMRKDLMASMGETEALIGWVLFDIGQLKEAALAWRSTLKIAKEIGDGALAACALGYWSYLAASRNDIAPAIKLLQQAEEYVPGNSAPATRSWIAAREAEELGRLGDETGSLRALERSFTAFDFARPRTERNWTGFFTASRLGGLTVSTYIALNHRDATAAANSLLSSLSPTDNKARALALADLTTLSARNNEFDRANFFVGQAIDVTTRTETSLARHRLLALASSLTAADRGASGALRDQILSTLRR